MMNERERERERVKESKDKRKVDTGQKLPILRRKLETGVESEKSK